MIKNYICHICIVLAIVMLVSSCAPGKNFTTRYYEENRNALNDIRERYRKLYRDKPFSVEFEDRKFNNISFEILSDTMKRIFHFNLLETSFADTLDKYQFKAAEVIGLVADMRAIRCTWISKLDYYENREVKQLTFISVRHHALHSFMKGERYYALAFFNEKQLFDQYGRLTDRSEKKRMREINGQVFRRITDNICYAITGNFR